MKIINAIEEQVTPFKEAIKRRKLGMLKADRDAVQAQVEGCEVKNGTSLYTVNPYARALKEKFGRRHVSLYSEDRPEYDLLRHREDQFRALLLEVSNIKEQIEQARKNDKPFDSVWMKTDEELEAMADEFAELVWIDFTNKMTVKFENFGEAREVEFYGDDPIENQMVVKFDNECEFTVKNSIVWKYSNRGTHFCQFPMRFTAPKRYGKKLKDLSTQKGCEYISNL